MDSNPEIEISFAQLAAYQRAKMHIRQLISGGACLSDHEPVYFTYELAMNGIYIDETTHKLRRMPPVMWAASKTHGRARAKVMALVLGRAGAREYAWRKSDVRGSDENHLHAQSDLNRALAIVVAQRDGACADLLVKAGAVDLRSSVSLQMAQLP